MEFVSGNIFVREMRLDKVGQQVEGHAHNFDHTTYVARGAMLVEALDLDGRVTRAVEKRASDGLNWILIKAGTKHRITALEPYTIGHCIYSHRTPQAEIVQEYDGWTPGYM